MANTNKLISIVNAKHIDKETRIEALSQLISIQNNDLKAKEFIE